MTASFAWSRLETGVMLLAAVRPAPSASFQWVDQFGKVEQDYSQGVINGPNTLFPGTGAPIGSPIGFLLLLTRTVPNG